MDNLFSILQIEVTTKCNASCLMCPRSIFRDKWISQDMDMKLFTKIIKDINHDLELIYLQGWGEPLLHPNLTDMIKYIKERLRTTVGLTTNAILLKDNICEHLLRSGLDIIAISFAGATRETHDNIRINCNFDIILKNIKHLIELRKTLKNNIKIIASYLMMKQNVNNLPNFIKLCNNLGIDEVVINNLTYIPSKTLYEYKAFSCYGEKIDKNIKHYIDEAKKIARELEQKVFIYDIECNEIPNCPEEPTKTIFINFNGDISPCVYTNIPIHNKIPRFFINKQLNINKVTFGNIKTENLYNIWNKEEYKKFREIFEKRIKLSKDLIEILSPTDETLTRNITLPEYCKTCYRIHNI